VQIEKPIYGGAFLARVAGKAVFVPLALPGEEARVRIVEEKRGYATAELEETIAAAAGRVAPACPHFGACGGCHYQHASYAAQLGYKQAILRETLARGGVCVPDEIAVVAGEPWGYRNRIRLAFDAKGNVGYRGRRSHAVIPVSACPIAAPLLLRAALVASELTRALPAQTRPSEILLFCNTEETALLASVTAAGGEKKQWQAFAVALAEKVPATKGVKFSASGEPPRTIAHWGERSLVYRAAGHEYRVDQGAFFQVNRWLVDALAERATAGHSGDLAWDLYAGVGLFARRLADKFARVVAVESAPPAKAALAHNLRGTMAEAVNAATLDFLRGVGKKERPELIVADPPRTGLGTETTTLLAAIAAPGLTYVSCDPATLARDLRALIASGYTIQSLAVADLFPQTYHLETVAQLRR